MAHGTLSLDIIVDHRNLTYLDRILATAMLVLPCHGTFIRPHQPLANPPCGRWQSSPKRRLLRVLSMWLCLGAFLAESLSAAPSAESGEALISDVIRRARAARKAALTYEFTRTKTSTFYKSEKEVASEENKVYRTAFVNGKFRTKLISINGESPPPKPVKAETVTGSEKPRTPRSERGGGADSILSQISDDAVHRFEYSIVSREPQAGRATLVVEVTPRKGLKARTIEEEVMAQLAGRIWVDELEHEVVKVDIALQDSVRVGWGGVLGALREFRLAVARTRSEAGEWINASSDVWIHFRQLFTSKRIRLKETVSEVRPIPRPQLEGSSR